MGRGSTTGGLPAAGPPSPSPRPMLDLAYVAGTVGFFALMLAYVAGCARLGAAPEDAGDGR